QQVYITIYVPLIEFWCFSFRFGHFQISSVPANQNPNSPNFSFEPRKIYLYLFPNFLSLTFQRISPFNSSIHRDIFVSKEMSPASKSKSIDKKAGKEVQKSSAKPSGSGNAVAGVPASAYNPLLGTFHTLEVPPTFSTLPVHSNGRFQNIDETDELPMGSVVAGLEYDSVSNNGSWSGESEDHKEKASNPPVRLEAVPGADNDKREKIRQKNERKHQRQKERRAQELHERCSGYLMSRKLEALAQQLVAMGFSHERATVALILNEGRVEESVAWLFEGGEEADNHKDKNIGGGNLKIDISEELARIADLETRYSCSKQEVERAVVACEGDIDRAAESLRELKLDRPPSGPPKTEETGDPPSINNSKQSGVVSHSARVQTKPILSPNQPKKDEKDFNYTKAAVMIGGSTESSNRHVQPLKKIQPKSEWAKPQQAAVTADKRWPSAGSNPSVSYSLASPLQVSSPTPAKTEASYMTVGGDYKNLQPGATREPVVVMQRPQTVNAKQVPAASMSSSPPGVAASWYPTNSVELMRPSGFMSHTPSTRSLSPNYVSSNQMYHQLQYQPQQQFVAGSSNSVDLQATNRGNSIWNRAGPSPMIAAASSLGLFSGLGSAATSGATSPVDWSTGGSMQFDYTNIDWSLDRGSGSSPTRSSALWLGHSPFTKSGAHTYGSNASGGVAQSSIRPLPSNGSIVPLPGLQDGGVSSAETSGSPEWSSPFEGKDLFSLPRQFVSSPTQ
ncbi:Ubiquitin-associated domain, partial [Sesbania bispinosa]